MKLQRLGHFSVRRIICLTAAVALVFFPPATAPAVVAEELVTAVKVALIVPAGERVSPVVMESIRENLQFQRKTPEEIPPFLIFLETVDAPASLAEAHGLFEGLRASGTLAVFNLCNESTGWYATEGAKETGIPMILFHSETVPLELEGKTPSPFLFGLDTCESFRTEALAFWARNRPEKSWAVLVDHLDNKSRTLGLDTVESLTASGLTARLVLLNRTPKSLLKQAVSENLRGGTEAFISFLSPSWTLQAARLIETSGTGGTIVYGRRPTEMLLRHEGLIAFSQRMPFAEEVPEEHAAEPVDRELFAKAVVASRWLAQALLLLDDLESGRLQIQKALTEVRQVPLGSGSIRLSSDLHGPAEKDIVVVESRHGTWSEKKRLKILVAEDGQWVIRRKGAGTSPGSP
jgi:hypothetical protein